MELLLPCFASVFLSLIYSVDFHSCSSQYLKTIEKTVSSFLFSSPTMTEPGPQHLLRGVITSQARTPPLGSESHSQEHLL